MQNAQVAIHCWNLNLKQFWFAVRCAQWSLSPVRQLFPICPKIKRRLQKRFTSLFTTFAPNAITWALRESKNQAKHGWN
jgi:hypothetical protein